MISSYLESETGGDIVFPSSVDWEGDTCDSLTKVLRIRNADISVDWACKAEAHDSPQTIADAVMDIVTPMLRDEIGRLKSELEDLILIKKKLEAGEIILLPLQHIDSSEFPEKDMEACEEVILGEFEHQETMYPSFISEKYGLDYDLVAACFDRLVKTGKIDER